jgi:hypothetical protein
MQIKIQSVNKQTEDEDEKPVKYLCSIGKHRGKYSTVDFYASRDILM